MHPAAFIATVLITIVTGCSSAQHNQADLSTRQVKTSCANYTMAGARHTECVGRYVPAY